MIYHDLSPSPGPLEVTLSALRSFGGLDGLESQ